MKYLVASLFFASMVFAGPVLQMNKAFQSLIELVPFLQNEDKFKDKKNEKVIKANLHNLNEAFRLAGHDTLIKHDLFAPSYALLTENLREGQSAFNKDKKAYAAWLLNETVTLCLDCHGRLPQSVTSSFQNGELSVDTSKFRDPYDIGISYMIVRRYFEAKEQFTRAIQDKLIKKDYRDLIRPFQNILQIELKIQKDPKAMTSIIDDFLSKKNLPYEVNKELESWRERLILWKNEKALTAGINNEKELKSFVQRKLLPLMDKASFDDAYKADLLLTSGLLSTYFFENQTSPSAPELSYWMGWIEKRLKKEEFMSSGDLFLKQCIRKYSKHPVAIKCLNEYKESVEFDFTGSAGTSIPSEVQNELNELNKLVIPPKK